jgi:hypothetical protein
VPSLGSLRPASQVEEIVRIDWKALVFESVEDEGAHGHVGLARQPHEMLTLVLAEAEGELERSAPWQSASVRLKSA